MKVIPRALNPSLNSTNGFTIGKTYVVAYKRGSLGVVINDHGGERAVPPDEGSNAHLVHRFEGLHGSGQRCAGYFEVVK